MSDFYRFDQEYCPSTRSQRLKLKRVNKRRLFARLILLLVLIGSMAFAGYTYKDEARAYLAGKVSETFAEEDGSARPGSKPEERKDPQMNLMLLGVDQRKNEPSRSDTIIVLMLNPETKKAHFISLPRDSRVAIEGFKNKTKLNHAHANGGMELAQKTIEELLDIEIHNNLETNFTGFENIIDLLGGVEMDVERRMYYPAEDINVKKGFQKLNGHKALGYVRYRSDGKGDLGRIDRQQKFLKALIEQHLKLGTLVKIPNIIGEIRNNIQTDLTVAEILWLAKSFHDTDSTNVKFHQLPGEPDYIGGGSYYIVDEEELHYLIASINRDLATKEEESSLSN